MKFLEYLVKGRLQINRFSIIFSVTVRVRFGVRHLVVMDKIMVKAEEFIMSMSIVTKMEAHCVGVCVCA